MIGWLQGKIVDKHQPGKLTLDVQGVGYDIETSLPTFFQLEHQSTIIELLIHTIVREDAILLYGFLTQDERALFRMLIKVNGVGPKLAINILSSITPSDFVQAIRSKNTLVLTGLSGVGKKTAERLVTEMQDNVDNLSLSVGSLSHELQASYHDQHEAIHALEALGYKKHAVASVIKKIDDGNKSCEQLIRQALQVLSVC